jgi:hypothetical protein
MAPEGTGKQNHIAHSIAAPDAGKPGVSRLVSPLSAFSKRDVCQVTNAADPVLG